ncbi:MAG: hypothetical protein JW909_07740 [Planctomycetes bacterium]|nr:hypothetical protein [Planctomycetota bacterium]
MFDMEGTPTFCESPHRNSLDTAIPGSEYVDGRDTGRTGEWRDKRWRGTATGGLVTLQAGASLRTEFEGSALSIVLPPNFVPPGPNYGPCPNGSFDVCIDGVESRHVSLSGAGREVLVGNGLSGGKHEAVVRCIPPKGDEAGDNSWGICGFRAWTGTPSAVRFQVCGHPLLGDLRADVEGPVRFSRSVREARWGWVSIVVPAPGVYRAKLKALGWKEETVEFSVSAAGTTKTLDPLRMTLEAPADPVEPRPLAANEPLVLICMGHANTWGQETAEYIARLVRLWNAHRPHAVILANEVNPAYVAGALRGLESPWVTGSGNHSMGGFEAFLDGRHLEARIGPAHLVAAGMEAADDGFEARLSRFARDASLRVFAGFQADAPWRRILAEKVRFYYYAHNLVRGIRFEENGTTYLRKPDANSYFRVEIGPPHAFEAPIRIERFTVRRED